MINKKVWRCARESGTPLVKKEMTLLLSCFILFNACLLAKLSGKKLKN
jgi:hypothetical protein